LKTGKNKGAEAWDLGVSNLYECLQPFAQVLAVEPDFESMKTMWT
jgi:hypothetical protein